MKDDSTTVKGERLVRQQQSDSLRSLTAGERDRQSTAWHRQDHALTLFLSRRPPPTSHVCSALHATFRWCNTLELGIGQCGIMTSLWVVYILPALPALPHYSQLNPWRKLGRGHPYTPILLTFVPPSGQHACWDVSRLYASILTPFCQHAWGCMTSPAPSCMRGILSGGCHFPDLITSLADRLVPVME